MRHRRKGAVLGRAPAHQRALLRNLASALFLTERDAELDDNRPKVAGRIITTLAKAKAVRPVVEKCVTLAIRAREHMAKAEPFKSPGERQSEAWRAWRNGDNWKKWAHAMAPAVDARRRLIVLLGDKKAVSVLIDTIAPRFAERRRADGSLQGGYTRVLKLSKPRLGDAGARAILEFVGKNDRTRQRQAVRPAFGDEAETAAQEG